ncbi:MAG: TIGR03746 family integrating conjugative element protein, partial [Gammaproteobacteria bacterium]
MRRYRTEIDNVRAHLRSLWVVIGLQFVVILALW